ncbi:MAG TPA: hypothetical protein IAB22_06680 [Candidatus Merdivicinus intestinavium]|nr:hypothetical protein [Candidatus Merdivicinus intestinavium]
MNYAFLIMGDYSPLRDRASMAGESVRMIGVSGLEEACRIAGELAAEGIDCIELCGAFGEKGARKVIEAAGGKIPVGYVVHLPEQDGLFEALFGPEN